MAEAAIQQMMQQLTNPTAAMAEMNQQNAQLRQQMAGDAAARNQRETDVRVDMNQVQHRGSQAAQQAVSQAQAAAAGKSHPGGSGGIESRNDQSASVSKWAPDCFDGKQESWRIFSLKFWS